MCFEKILKENCQKAGTKESDTGVGYLIIAVSHGSNRETFAYTRMSFTLT
jgi:hypothetical protein